MLPILLFIRPNSLPLLRKQLADTNHGIENILNAIQQGILTSSIKERLEELEKPKYNREDIIEWISRFKYGAPNNKEYRRQIIDIFLNSIYVFDDKLVFTYNYKNGMQTVTLADVFAAFGLDLEPCTPSKQIAQIILRYLFFIQEQGMTNTTHFKT